MAKKKRPKPAPGALYPGKRHSVLSDERLAQLERAYHLIVLEGHTVASAARVVGMNGATLHYHVKKNGWLAARVLFQELDSRVASDREITAQAITFKTNTLRMLIDFRRWCSEVMLSMKAKFLELNDCVPKTITMPDGTQQQRMIPKGSATEFASFVRAYNDLIRSIKELSGMRDLRLLQEIQRLKKAQRARDREVGQERFELLAQAPMVDVVEDDGEEEE